MSASSETGQPPIDGYGLIGDCRTAALVSRDGSIDWLCLPNFDSPSIFARLLDPVAGGCFSIKPRYPFTSKRRYLDATCVLETTFEAHHGQVRILDLMPIMDDSQGLSPMREVLRIIEGVAGEVELTISIDPRPGYGRTRPGLRGGGRLGWSYFWSNKILLVHADIALSRADLVLSGSVSVRAGERRYISLAYVQNDPAVIPGLSTRPTRALTVPNRGGADGAISASTRVSIARRCCGAPLRSRPSASRCPARSSPRRRHRCLRQSAANATGITATAGCAMRG